MISIRAFFHPGSENQSVGKPEYEIFEDEITRRVVAAHNGKVYNGRFIRVIDTSKPVFFIVNGITSELVWKLSHHIDGTTRASKIDVKERVFSSDVGVMIYERNEEMMPFRRYVVSIRRGDEEYSCGDKELLKDKSSNPISPEYLLACIAGELPFESLKDKALSFRDLLEIDPSDLSG